MQDKVCIVTGANRGIGKAAAQGLAGLGATVVLACRDPVRGEEAAADIRAATGNLAVEPMLVDLASQQSVHLTARSGRPSIAPGARRGMPFILPAAPPR